MSASEERTPEEWTTLLEFHPEYKALFVEGTSDVALWKHLFSLAGIDSISVFPVAVVRIKDSVVSDLGFHVGERGRNIAFGHLLATQSTDLDGQVVCFADRDFLDIVPDPAVNTRYTLLTTFASIELHAFSSPVVTKLAAVAFGQTIDGSQFIDSAEEHLRELFILRGTALRLNWGLKWVSCRKFLKKGKAGGFTFRRNAFLKTFLNGGGKQEESETFEKEATVVRNKLSGLDPKQCIRGHDFLELFNWFFKEEAAAIGMRTPKGSEALGKFLVASVDNEVWKTSDDFRLICKALGIG